MVHICDCTPAGIREALDELPDTLDETYERTLRWINNSNWKIAHRIFQFVLVASRPLHVNELADLLAFDFEAGSIPKFHQDWRLENPADAVLSRCSTLLAIVNNYGSPIIQFSHFSVKEFLSSTRLAEATDNTSRRYHVSMTPAHTLVAQACLGILLHLDKNVTRDSLGDFPLAKYAAKHWVDHVQFDGVSRNVEDGMKQLFDTSKPHFATWLWIYNKDRGGGSMTTMRPEIPEAVPLYYAAQLGFRDLAEHLIAEHPEHVSATGGFHVTPIHAAAFAGQTDILSLLIRHGADVNGRGRTDDTPLFLASIKARTEAGRLLLDHDAITDAQNEFDITALISAILWGNIEFVQMLLERGAAVNARCYNGMSPLHWAANQGRIETVRLLLDHGADVNAPDKFGDTPSQFALRKKHPEIVELLSEYRYYLPSL